MRFLALGGGMFTTSLRDRGHEVLALGPPGTGGHLQNLEIDLFSEPERARDRVREIASAFRPDWILQTDDSTPLIHLGLEDLPFPRAWYAIDSHLHREWHRHFAPLFDAVFYAQKNQSESVAAYRGDAAEWLPLFFGAEPAFLPWDSRGQDVAFVGSLDAARNPSRIALLDALKARGVAVHVRQGEYRPVYSDSRIVINQAVKDDLNFRFFEAMGCGALLITDRLTHSMEDFGRPGEDFLVYAPGDADDLLEKIRWGLGHPREAEAIARRGHARVTAAHRVLHRAARMEAALEGRSPAGGDRGHVLGHLSAAHERVSRLSLPPSLAGFFAAEARRLALLALAAAPGNSWGRISLAQLDFEQGKYREALECLDGADGEEGGAEFRKRYFLLRILLLAHTGRVLLARRSAAAALLSFPGDRDLESLAAVLAG